MIQFVKEMTQKAGLEMWDFSRQNSTHYQLFLYGEKIEAKRKVKDRAGKFRLFLIHENGDSEKPKLGHTSFPVTADMTKSDFLKMLKQGLRHAGCVYNPLRTLPVSGLIYPPADCFENGYKAHFQDLLSDIANKIIRLVRKEKNISISHSELYLTFRTTLLVNSNQLELKGEETFCSMYLILLAEKNGDQIDQQIEIHRRSFNKMDLENIVRSYSAFARDRLSGSLPQTGTFPVIISDSALDHFFAPLLFHSSGRATYEGLSRFKKDKPITNGCFNGDAVSLKVDATWPMGNKTVPFGPEGLPPQEVKVIEDNIFKNLICDQKYADYLNIRPTGPTGNVILQEGKAGWQELIHRNGNALLYHIPSFSSLMPDPVTGDFKGEIRTGYEYSSKGIRPIRGGAISGNIFDALLNARLSSEKVFRGDYYGPAALRFENLIVSGT